MWDGFCARFSEFKKWVIERVLWAETEMADKTGPERRAYIVQRLDDLIKLPFWLEWADGMVIGWIVDRACDKLNWLTDHDIAGAQVTAAQAAELADVLDAKTSKIDTRGKSVDERLEDLYRQYGIPRQTAPTEGGDLTRNFSRKEFACKCGCGKDDVEPRLAEMCQTIRDAVGVPVRVNSGCRCAAHNAKVGGAVDSYHTKGLAADLSCSIGARALAEAIQALHVAGKLDGLEYCLRYPTFVHIDIGKKRKQRFAVKA